MPEPRPTLGRIVHFRPPAPAGEKMPANWLPTKSYAALVTEGATDDGKVCLTVFAGRQGGSIDVDDVPPDDGGDAGGWSWPPIVK
jgi:hypothetical protein